MAYGNPPSYPAVRVESEFVTLHFSVTGGFMQFNYDLFVYGEDTVLDELSPNIAAMMPHGKLKRKSDDHCIQVNVGSQVLDELSPHISAMTQGKIKRKDKEHCIKLNAGNHETICYTQIQFFKMMASRGFVMKSSNSMPIPAGRPQFYFTFAR